MSEQRKRGRPSIKTAEICAEIIDRLSEGEPLAQICRDEGMPSLRVVYNWMDSDSDFSASIAHARVAGYDIIAQDAMRIADTPVEGVIEKMEKNEAGELVVTERRREDMLGHRKLQVETRLKLLAKWDPKRYGDKLELDAKVEHAVDPTKAAETIEMIVGKLGI